MNNREIFEVAEIEVIAFDAEDIIRTSIGDSDDVPGTPTSNSLNELNWLKSHR
jgi:hypothetical protein